MKILIIEDDIELLKNLTDSLKQDCFTVVTAQTGKMALQKYTEDVFDLVLLDLNLPDMDGIDILEKIRKGKIPSVHVLILTAKYELEDKVIGLDAGADDYLAKPFSMVELKARIRAILRRSSTNKQIKLHINNIEINIAEGSVQNYIV
ncbi:response regulator transcription factor [Sulfurospirillum diekertiae]|uniref:Response regulator transcription factor n=1 Tax=Sulfurospirillum diekertiae TaxID=1854492 RepID=A0A6G9VU60_9BACT|nr:response regulator transcription factor [Sulfurospirillum diekertiae]QIR76210.1 response regulator transcription factor [Sulfurospirillum diekertiae]QIR78838.1 response regulator transcription factor [Sulfurospirillum diekertiae]